jgi:hypothetical protein
MKNQKRKTRYKRFAREWDEDWGDREDEWPTSNLSLLILNDISYLLYHIIIGLTVTLKFMFTV